jgi:branched-chain amino acid transport system ATP-binding protein
MTMLEIAALDHAYGRHSALRNVSLRVAPAEVVAILGANGAGKTTLLNAVAGLLRPSAGTIRYQGNELVGLSAHRIVALGIATVTETRHLFGPLSVTENLALGAFTAGATAAATMAHVFELFPRLAERKRQAVRTMSGGEQQMVAVGRALMARPQLMLMDEPSMGLAPVFVDQVFDIIKTINGQGTTILVVEQNAAVALSIAHRGYVLRNGRIVIADTAAALLQADEVRRAYLGEV